MIVKFGAKPASWSAGRPAEEVPGEDAGPGRLGVDAQRAAMRLGGPDEAVLAVQVAVLAVGHEAGPQALVVRLRDRPVDGAPPDLRLARRLGDDELVLGRPAGVLAGADDERAVGGDQTLAVADRVLVQLGDRQVRADRAPERVAGPWCGSRGHRWFRLLVRRRSRSIDRPRVTRPSKRVAGVGFRSRVARMLARCEKVAARVAAPGSLTGRRARP